LTQNRVLKTAPDSKHSGFTGIRRQGIQLALAWQWPTTGDGSNLDGVVQGLHHSKPARKGPVDFFGGQRGFSSLVAGMSPAETPGSHA